MDDSNNFNFTGADGASAPQASKTYEYTTSAPKGPSGETDWAGSCASPCGDGHEGSKGANGAGGGNGGDGQNAAEAVIDAATVEGSFIVQVGGGCGGAGALVAERLLRGWGVGGWGHMAIGEMLHTVVPVAIWERPAQARAQQQRRVLWGA